MQSIKQPSKITNITFDEIQIGDTASFTREVSDHDVALFAKVSGDYNPIHLDAEYASKTLFNKRIAHGMLTGALISAAIASTLPGPGSIYLGQNIRFKAPVFLGDTVTVQLKITDKNAVKPWVTISTTVVNQENKLLAEGEATVVAPTTKESVTWAAPD